MKIRWYRTNLPPITFPTAFNNRFIDPDSWKPQSVGEVALWEADRKYNGAWTQPTGLNGLHQCEPADFATGQAWPYDGPPIQYDSAGIPFCCDRDADGASGGVEVGGETGDVLEYVNPTSGGVEVGGSAGDVIEYIDGAEGGVEVGGSAGDVIDQVDGASGGVEVGGSAGDVIEYIDGASGGVEVGGSAGDVVEYIDGAEGGVEVGGSAGDVFIPPSSPGATCDTAIVLTINTPHAGSVGAGVDQWFKITFGSPTPIYTSTDSGTGSYASQVYSGSCASLSPVASWTNDDCRTIGTVGGGTTIFVKVTGTTATTFNVTVGFGACP